ncbi:MAG: hypothetical protein QE279_11970 [Rhodoferax sp.]|jgi:hypothetical protein|nr:hypothetical protein [Rhodoferax sp.]
MAAHSFIAITPQKTALPRQPFALRHLARDAAGHAKIQLRHHGKPRNDDLPPKEKAPSPREHQS